MPDRVTGGGGAATAIGGDWARPDRTDAQLLALLASPLGAASEEAFATLVDRHAPRLRRLCRGLVNGHHDADDLLQATLLVFLRRAGTIRDPEALGAWLQGVARKIAASMRSGRGGAASSDTIHLWEPTCGPDAEASAMSVETVPIIHDEVRRLPSRYRDPILLCCLEGKTNEEAARLLKVPVGTVKGRLSRARVLLKDRLLRRGLAVGAGLLALVRPGRLMASERGADSTASVFGFDVPKRVVALFVALAIGLLGASAWRTAATCLEGLGAVDLPTPSRIPGDRGLAGRFGPSLQLVPEDHAPRR